MKRKVLSAVLAAAMVFVTACGNKPANSDNQPTQAPSNNTAAPPSNTAAPTAAPTADPKSQGEILADQYNGFVETPMNLNGRTIRIACSEWSRYNYVQKNGKDDVSVTPTLTVEVINILKEIEKDYNCKFEVTPKRKGADIVADLIDGKAQGEPIYDIIDEGVSDTYMDQIFSQGLVMDMNDPAIKDIIKFDSNPWKTQSDYGVYNGTQYAVNFVIKNSSNNDLCNALFFNKELAAQFELGDIYQLVKDNKWTWAVFEEMCEKIAKQSNGTVVPAGYGKEDVLFPMTVFSNGAKMADDIGGRRTYLGNTDDKVVAAYQWIYDLREKGYLAPNWTEKNADGKSEFVEGGIDFYRFAAGECVFFFDFYGDLQKLLQNTMGSQTVTNYHFGLLPHPLGPGGDKCHGVTYSVDLMMIPEGVEKPEEVAAVLVAIANRTSKTSENIYDIEAEMTLDGSEDLDMLKIMYEDLRTDVSRAYTEIPVGNAGTHVLKMDQTPEQALEAIAEETQGIYDGTVKKW